MAYRNGTYIAFYADGTNIPIEIRYAVDDCDLPVIAAYVDHVSILAPAELSSLWPSALKTRIDNKTVKVIHIPFKKKPIAAVISQFTVMS
jgi:hypothetical protein